MSRREGYRVALAVGAAALGMALLLWFSPEDRVLGVRTKLVYLHGALIVASLLLYGAAAVAALVFLGGRGERAFRAATGVWVAATAANAVSLPTGLYAARVIWGGLPWDEPRFLTNAGILLIGLMVLGVALLSANRRGVAALYALAAGLFAVMIRQTGRILHPVNPIGRSDSWAIKLSFLALLLLVLALVAEALRPFVRPGRRS